jgi:hypothetical protein
MVKKWISIIIIREKNYIYMYIIVIQSSLKEKCDKYGN